MFDDFREIGTPKYTGDMPSAWRHAPVYGEDFNKEYFAAARSKLDAAKNNSNDSFISFDQPGDKTWDWFMEEGLKIQPNLHSEGKQENPKAKDNP